MTESNQSFSEDEVSRIRLRHRAALTAGMSNAEATKFANDPNSPTLPSVQVKSSTATTSSGNGDAQLNSDCSAELVAMSPALSPEPPPSLSTDDTGHHELDADHVMTKNSGLPESPDGQRPLDSAQDCVVGCKRNRVDTRFKNGHPKLGGRRKGQRNKSTVVKETFDEKITIREGNRTRSVTKLHAMIIRMINDAIAGNAKAQSNVIALARLWGLFGEADETANSEPIRADDLALIVDFLGRHRKQTETAQPGEGIDESKTGEAKPPRKDTKEPGA